MPDRRPGRHSRVAARQFVAGSRVTHLNDTRENHGSRAGHTLPSGVHPDLSSPLAESVPATEDEASSNDRPAREEGTDSRSPLDPRRGAGPAERIARGATLGRYIVLDPIGEGAMGIVYAAYDPELDRKLAVKLLRALPGDPVEASRGRARLLREGQAMARLSHPNVAAVHDVGTYAEQVFVAMGVRRRGYVARLARGDAVLARRRGDICPGGARARGGARGGAGPSGFQSRQRSRRLGWARARRRLRPGARRRRRSDQQWRRPRERQ